MSAQPGWKAGCLPEKKRRGVSRAFFMPQKKG